MVLCESTISLKFYERTLRLAGIMQYYFILKYSQCHSRVVREFTKAIPFQGRIDKVGFDSDNKVILRK